MDAPLPHPTRLSFNKTTTERGATSTPSTRRTPPVLSLPPSLVAARAPLHCSRHRRRKSQSISIIGHRGGKFALNTVHVESGDIEVWSCYMCTINYLLISEVHSIGLFIYVVLCFLFLFPLSHGQQLVEYFQGRSPQYCN